MIVSKASCDQPTRSILLTASTTWRMPSIETMSAVPARLRGDALARIDQQHGEIGGRGAGRHVARVLLVAGRVGDDEGAPSRREKAVGDVDGDALLALGREAVDAAARSRASSPCVPCLRESRFSARELIVEELLGVVQQAADQGRLAVVDRAAGDEAQDSLVALARAGSASRPTVHRVRRGRSSEIAFLLLALHRGGAVAGR